MSVETWDPSAPPPGLNAANLARLEAAAGRLDEPGFGLDADAAAELARLSRHDPTAGVDWVAAAEGLENDAVIALIRLFTLAEDVYSAWQAGAASPVVPLAAALRRRGRYPDALTAWIRARSSNRFLPYGSLMDRL